MSAAGFAISSAPLNRCVAALALSAGVEFGCRAADEAGLTETQLAGPPPDLEMKWEEQPLSSVAATPARPVPVTEGLAPQLYLSDFAATVRVIDLTENKFLAEAVVRPRTIVRVDERNGVVADSEVLFSGPLPKGRRYGIYIMREEENRTRTGTLQPKPPRKAADPDGAGTQDEVVQTGSPQDLTELRTPRQSP